LSVCWAYAIIGRDITNYYKDEKEQSIVAAVIIIIIVIVEAMSYF